MTSISLPDWLASTLASDATGGMNVLPPWISARSTGITCCGPALTATVTRDDNSSMKDVPAAVTVPGTVLVVTGGSESRTAILGDLVARELLKAGIIAVVSDGLIRDSDAVRELGLAVWCRGVTPIASRKDGTGHVGGTVAIAGVEVSDGDIIVADSDGVVVWPAARTAELLEAADRKRIADEARALAI